MKKQANKKQKWSKFIITKIKLNPEQAVLSCCDTSVRANGLKVGTIVVNNCLEWCGTAEDRASS
ncbi:MAG: hypothetical protein PHP69_03350 [Candidatus Omnitrophica bacterium]|nr:hypothetical protein [Candidatus Omnitrophota bacterium]MDD5081716.1 hypothetical protein [Candidatus Omnitrophota bacterium]